MKKIVSDKVFIYRVIIYIILSSLIGLFLFSFICKKELTLGIMNDWVSFILGIVATILSIVSLYLGFYNVDEAKSAQEKSIRDLNNLGNKIIEEVDKTTDKFTNIVSREIKYNLSDSSNYIKKKIVHSDEEDGFLKDANGGEENE